MNLKPAEKRLILFAPQMYPWLDIYENWDMVVYNPSNVGEELDDVGYQNIINAIVSSVED